MYLFFNSLCQHKYFVPFWKLRLFKGVQGEITRKSCAYLLHMDVAKLEQMVGYMTCRYKYRYSGY